MNIQKNIYLTVSGLVLIVLLSGCPLIKNYGKLRVQYGLDKKMTIQRLEEKWQDYVVYYAGVHTQFPSAVLFDPKDDERTLLTHERWVQVKDQQELSEVIRWIWGEEYLHLPQLWKILGPHNHFYGYIYTAWDHAHIKLIDEKTLWVDDIPLPPLKFGPPFAAMR